MKKTEYVSLAAGMVFHPVYALRSIKRNRLHFRLWVPVLLILVTCVVYVVSIACFHFPLALYDLRESNLLLEIAKVAAIVGTWVVAGYIMTSINDGEMTFKEFTTATAYALVPMLVLTPLLALASTIMSGSEAGFFDTVLTLIILWCAFTMILSVGILNSYSFGEAVKVLLLIVFAIVLIWFIAFVLYAMASQTVRFVGSVIKEIAMLLQYGR